MLNVSLNEQYSAQGRPFLTRICLAFSFLEDNMEFISFLMELQQTWI